MKYPMDKLGSHIDILSGFAFKSSDFIGSGIPVIKIKNITPPSVTLEDLSFVSEEIAEQQTKFILNFDDVLIALTGSHINQMASVVGRVARVKYNVPSLLNQRVGKITVLNPAESNIDYIYYYLSQDSVKIKLASKAGGAANQANISPTDIKNLIIPFPDIAIQNKIACILSAYDNLIESNQKQIKLLEEAAQRLYKEWFIDLRFPGHESTPIHDGVPEGWERKSVEECLQMHINGGWGKESPEAKNCIPGRVIRGTDINDVKAGNLNDIPLRYHTENDVRKKALRQEDIIFELSNGNLANIGRTLFVDDLLLQYCGNPTICASFCKLFRPVDRLHALMLCWEIQDMQASSRMLPYKKHGANGINNFDFDGFLQHELLIPVNLEFVKPFDLVMQKESVIQHELMLLAEARDRLLPKLMSGEIEV